MLGPHRRLTRAPLTATVLAAVVVGAAACVGSDPDALPFDGADAATRQGTEDGTAAFDDGGGDGATDDGGPAASSDNAPLTDGGVLANGDFESLACEGWTTTNSYATTETTAHDGKYACLVCPKKSASVYGIAQRFSAANVLQKGGTYTLSVWLRAPTTGKTSTDMYLGVNLDDGPGSNGVFSETAVTPLAASYAEQSRGFHYDLDGGPYPSLEIQILNRTEDDGCFLVGAASFVRNAR